MLLATFNCFQVPYILAFVELDSTNVALDVINSLIDIIFMLDVLVNFRTSFVIENTGIEVTNPKDIAIRYMKGRFWLDVLASLPLDSLTYAISKSKANSFMFQILGLLKLVRVLRLSKLITYLNLKSDVKMSLKLGKLIFFIILFLHCLGCLWYYIVQFDKEWIPPLDYVFIETTLYEQSGFTRY